MLVDVLKYRKTFRFDHLLVCKTNVLLDQRLHHFEVLWARQFLLYFLDDKDTVLVFHHALHHVLFLQDLEEFSNQALKIIKKKNVSYFACPFNTFFKDLLREVLNSKLGEIFLKFIKYFLACFFIPVLYQDSLRK